MLNTMEYRNVKPLIKWAGGKRQLINELYQRIPINFNCYYEPFIGGASFLVYLYNMNIINKAVISDLNAELINFYNVIKYNEDEFLLNIKNQELKNDSETYYKLRERFNCIKGNNEYKIERAVLFIYLNKHAYNGLWRVNSKNFFNVPFGKYKNVNIINYGNVHNFHIMLKKINILNLDFEMAVKNASENDFVYFDPPYMPLNKTSYFTGYTKEGFNYSDQIRLFNVFKELTDKNVKLMLSNSYSDYIIDLYKEFNISIVNANRFINSDKNKRTGSKELIITNY